ncbi:dihydrofolate reductase [Dokdonella sp. MW10]|uniref:dihydrofolate reductase n=1 Tax=Dokdonella sp. MW10 TaxID=2992926 RepID=UPI003F81DD8A
MIALVAALDRAHAIGFDGAMPWHLPDDLRRFKALTLGKPVLMGRRTAESIGRRLPGRTNLVLTRGDTAPYEGQLVVRSLDDAIAHEGEALMVIGGGEVYALALPQATHLHLTWIDTLAPQTDAWFPRFDASEWTVTAEATHAADAKHAHAFRFVDYVRRT